MKSLLFLSVLFYSPASFAQNLVVKAKDLQVLYTYMAGEFTSEAQATADTDFFSIKLRMTPIWKGHPAGYWLYVEQALADSEDKPYRQRVYRLYQQDDTTLVSKVYELKNPKQYIGGWNDATKLAPITVDSLIEREGCGIYLHKAGKEVFSGSTPGKQCISSLRGAAYATSQVVIHPEMMVSWDRGWDKYDKQVWGAVKSGYIFVKTMKYKI